MVQNFQPRRVDTVDLSLPVRLLFSSREKETHSKNSPVNKLSKLWYFHVFLSQITLLNFSAIESRVKILLLCFSTLSLSLLRVNHGNGRACASTRFDARSDNTRAAVSGPGRFKPRETSSRFSFATPPPPKKAIVFVTRCSGVEWMFRSLQNRAFPGAKLRG